MNDGPPDWVIVFINWPTMLIAATLPAALWAKFGFAMGLTLYAIELTIILNSIQVSRLAHSDVAGPNPVPWLWAVFVAAGMTLWLG